MDMTRGPRLQELGLPLHVIAQGTDRCALFRDDYALYGPDTGSALEGFVGMMRGQYAA